MAVRESAGGTGTNQYTSRGGAVPPARRATSAAAAAVSNLFDEDPPWRNALESGGPLTDAEWADVVAHGDNEFRSDPHRALEHPDVPPFVVGALTGHSSGTVRLKAIRHPQCPIDVIIRALDDRELTASAAFNSAVPVEAVEARIRRCGGMDMNPGEEPNSRFLIGVVANTALPDHVHLLAVSEAASNPSTLLKASVLRVAAESESASPAVLSVVYQHASVFDNTVALVARHPNCPTAILSKLAASRVQNVRDQVLANPNCPADALGRFSKSKRNSTRVRVAKHPNATAELLERMLRGESDKRVLGAIVENPACPEVVRVARAFLR